MPLLCLSNLNLRRRAIKIRLRDHSLGGLVQKLALGLCDAEELLQPGALTPLLLASRLGPREPLLQLALLRGRRRLELAELLHQLL